MGYFQVRYDSRVIIYNRRGFIRLATDHHFCSPTRDLISFYLFLFYLPFTFSFSLSSFSKWPKPASFCLFLFCCVRLSISFLFYLPFSFSFSLSLFLNGPTLASFCLFLFSFNNNFNGKIVDFSTGFKLGSLEYAS